MLIQVILQCAMPYRLFESYDMKCGMNLNSKIMRNEVDFVMCNEFELSRGHVHM